MSSSPQQDRTVSCRKVDARAAPGSTSLVITGFVGTGKTVVGRCVAERLGRA